MDGNNSCAPPFIGKVLPCSWGLEQPGSSHSTVLLLADELARQKGRLKEAPVLPSDACPDDGGKVYRPGAMAPSDAFQFVPIDKLPMAKSAPKYPGEFIAVVQLQELAVLELRDLAPRLLHSDESAFQRSVEVVRRSLRRSFHMSGPAVVNGIATQRPGLRTVTVDKDRSRRIGLHLDSWERVHFRRRRFARNRISVNLGEEPRHFLFMATPIEVLFDRLGISPAAHLYAVDQAFDATKSHQRRAYDLCVYPGEAYIAPTECLVHDASTLQTRNAGSSLTIRLLTVPAADCFSGETAVG